MLFDTTEGKGHTDSKGTEGLSLALIPLKFYTSQRQSSLFNEESNASLADQSSVSSCNKCGLIACPLLYQGELGTPYNGPFRKAPTERGTFNLSGFRYMKG